MRQFRFFLTLVFTLMMFSVFSRLDLAQGASPWRCTHAPGSQLYRPDGLVIRWEARNQRLVLVSIDGGTIVRTLETSLTTYDLANLDWSPNCRYLFGTGSGDAIIWDTASGGRVATFAHVTPKNPPYWNPGRDNLILEANGGSYLWNFTQSAPPLLLTFDGDFCRTHYRYFNWQVEWDNARGQVLVVPNFVDGNTVIAYDQTSAQQVAAFNNGCLQGPLKFGLTPDDRHVIVFTSENEAFAGSNKGITVWDRDTMQHVTVSAGSQSAVLPGQVALSADGRTLALARVGALRVWDLTQNRLPIHRYPIALNTISTRFISDTIVETRDFNGNTARWDIGSGARAD